MAASKEVVFIVALIGFTLTGIFNSLSGCVPEENSFYTTLTNFSMKYLVMCKVCTDVGGIK